MRGLGIGNGRQKLFFLPEPHTDFIFSIIGEELGFIGAFALIGLFARKVTSLGWTLAFGTLVGALLAFVIAHLGGKYYLEIILPGSLVGLLTGYATVRYGRVPSADAASRSMGAH